MGLPKSVSILSFILLIAAFIATTIGIFSNNGPGQYTYQSIHGQNVTIYGKGIYQYMSQELAPQGIAQDVVTLFVAIPLLIISLVLTRRNLLKGKILLAGTLAYFFLTYLFYINMAMYNPLFLVYVLLASSSFFALVLTLTSFEANTEKYFSEKTPTRFAAGFLLFSVTAITLLWLSVVVPPLLNGTIYPKALEHYTTLVVQGLDLSLFLPLGFVSGWLLWKKRPFGYVAASVYLVFLSLLMTALTSKLVFQILFGATVGIPPLVMIPLFTIFAIIASVVVIKNIQEKRA